MSRKITPMRVDDAIASANAFLNAERGVPIDGGFADRQVMKRVATVRERAEALLRSVRHPGLERMYVPLSKYNYSPDTFDQAATVLPGHLVLVPSTLIDPDIRAFYPGVVSEDGLKTRTIRLHVLRQPYRQKIRYGASMILSAAGQSETKGIGDHGRKSDDGVEAEHFATLLAAGSDTRVQAAWQSGVHINHTWREQAGNSVTSEFSERLFGSAVPQKTITITAQQIKDGRAMLLWHEGMRDSLTGLPETATRDNALVVIQSLGYEALQTINPQAIDTVKSLIA